MPQRIAPNQKSPSEASANRTVDRLVGDTVVYLHEGEYKFFNLVFKEWIPSKTF